MIVRERFNTNKNKFGSCYFDYNLFIQNTNTKLTKIFAYEPKEKKLVINWGEYIYIEKQIEKEASERQVLQKESLELVKRKIWKDLLYYYYFINETDLNLSSDEKLRDKALNLLVKAKDLKPIEVDQVLRDNVKELRSVLPLTVVKTMK